MRDFYFRFSPSIFLVPLNRRSTTSLKKKMFSNQYLTFFVHKQILSFCGLLRLLIGAVEWFPKPNDIAGSSLVWGQSLNDNL